MIIDMPPLYHAIAAVVLQCEVGLVLERNAAPYAASMLDWLVPVADISYLEDTYNKAFDGGGLEISGVTSFMRRFNSDFGGSISGIATLVAGTVTVTTGEIKSTDLIALTIVNTSGTTGVHYIDSKTPSSNFVIKSTSATDGSTLLWEIQHIV